ncbi:MAG: hypothetical protein J0H99_26650 [Rhodospirillales bacterium]|nr:hypothetical protein [Rhodospirillales bacterium]
MSVYSLTYDLRAPDKDYSGLIAAIKKFDTCRATMSQWLISTDMSAAAIRDYVGRHADANDVIFVQLLGVDWAGRNLPQDVVDWLKRRRMAA